MRLIMSMPRKPALLLCCALSLTAVNARAADLIFDLKLENGRLPESMRVVRVTQGDVLRLRWQVDRPVILHLHGYDIEKRVDPGAVAEMTLTARATGRFPLHAHATGASAGDRAHDEAPLLYVEVYPR